MTKEQWDKLTPSQQKDVCFKQLADMLDEAAKEIYFTPNNNSTRIINGNTTIIMSRDDEIPQL